MFIVPHFPKSGDNERQQKKGKFRTEIYIAGQIIAGTCERCGVGILQQRYEQKSIYKSKQKEKYSRK